MYYKIDGALFIRSFAVVLPKDQTDLRFLVVVLYSSVVNGICCGCCGRLFENGVKLLSIRLNSNSLKSASVFQHRA
jgi:hypothetical protein